MTTEDSKEQQNAVSLKLPTFWTSQPEVWFEQTEAQFHIRQITADTTKFYYVVSALHQDTAGHVIDFLRHPPTDDIYQGIKKLLIGTFGLSRRARVARLLHMDGLGDRKPSMLMNEMLALMDGHVPCLLFYQLFPKQMPNDIHLIFADETFTDPRQLAARADVLWHSKQHDETSINNGITVKRRSAGTTSARSDETTLKSPTNSSEKWCYYHQRWGKDAYRCRPPCTHPRNAVLGRR